MFSCKSFLFDLQLSDHNKQKFPFFSGGLDPDQINLMLDPLRTEKVQEAERMYNGYISARIGNYRL